LLFVGIGAAVFAALILIIWLSYSYTKEQAEEREHYANVRTLEGIVSMIARDYGVEARNINISREGRLTIYWNYGGYDSMGSIVGTGSNAYIRAWPSVRGESYYVSSGKVYPVDFPERRRR
jgi:hypothetical protein